jgi:hypothetical protein
MANVVFLITIREEAEMPGGDKTGPKDVGPLTGRQMGYCAGDDIQSFTNIGYGRRTGRGFNKGFGIGRGRGIRRGSGFGNDYGYFPDESIPVPQKTGAKILPAFSFGYKSIYN